MPVVGRIPGAPYSFEVELSGGEVVPGPGLPSGSGAVSLNVTAGGEVCFSFEFNGITGVTAAHIHEGATGEVGPHVVDLGVSGGTVFGCVTTTTETAVAILDAPENYHVQVHSSSHPDGAVRGQLASARMWELSLVGANVTGPGDADGFATLALEASTSGRVCVSRFSAQRIATVTSIGLYTAGAGADGPRVVDLTFGADHSGCAVVSPRSAASMILATPSAHYTQVNTTQFPAGAIRAQLTPGI